MSTGDGYIGAGVALLVAVLAALLVRRLFNHASDRTDERVDPVLATRLRVVRNLIVAGILTLGVFAAISRIHALDQLATTLLASSAIVAAVVGFASRQALGNAIAGILLAASQPVRIGDFVTVGAESGVVEDIKLSTTYLRTGTNARVIVPNEQMIGSMIRNDTIVSATIATEVALWLPAHADAGRATALLEASVPEAESVRITEMSPEGAVRLLVAGPPSVPAERLAHEGELRAACLAQLRAAGLLHAAEQDQGLSGRK